MNQTIKIPEGYRLIQKNEQEYEIIPVLDFSILNNKNWFKIKLKTNETVFSKGDIFNNCKSWFTNSNDIFDAGALDTDRSFFVSIEKATEEEIEKIYQRAPHWREKPKWEDFGYVKGFYIDSDSMIMSYDHESTDEFNTYIWPTKEEAQACLALSQLCQWRDKYNKGWKPSWIDDNMKYCIFVYNNNISTNKFSNTKHILAFQTNEIRDKFLEDFPELIITAKPLL